jgi:small-conductance mechanosensitive channel
MRVLSEMDAEFLERPVISWIVAAATFVLIVLAFPIARGVIRGRVGKPTDARSWRMLVARLLDRWLRLTTLVIAGVAATMLLVPDARVEYIARLALVIVLAIQLAALMGPIVDWALARATTSASDSSSAAANIAGTLAGMRWLLLLAVYAVIVLLALQNLNVDVTAMVAGLGIGGIAIALAVQNILGDLFGSLTIALDKPFVQGDFIVVGTEMGTVEHVGLKTTRVRSISGEQLVFANSDLLGSRIRNFKRMQERRVLFQFGVVYDTSPEVVQQIPSIVRGCIESQQKVKFDRCHFFRFGESSLDYEAVYYIETPDYNAHMDVQQAVHLSILRSFTERGISFAFPTQTVVHVNAAKVPHAARESV